MAGGVVAVAPGTALLIAVLLCPAIAFYLTEAARVRPVARAMLLCGSAATFSPIRALWESGNTLAAALDLLSDIACPLLAWGGCAAGWLLYETVHIAARLALEASSRRRIKQLQEENASLRAEWMLSESSG